MLTLDAIAPSPAVTTVTRSTDSPPTPQVESPHAPAASSSSSAPPATEQVPSPAQISEQTLSHLISLQLQLAGSTLPARASVEAFYIAYWSTH